MDDGRKGYMRREVVTEREREKEERKKVMEVEEEEDYGCSSASQGGPAGPIGLSLALY